MHNLSQSFDLILTIWEYQICCSAPITLCALFELCWIVSITCVAPNIAIVVGQFGTMGALMSVITCDIPLCNSRLLQRGQCRSRWGDRWCSFCELLCWLLLVNFFVVLRENPDDDFRMWFCAWCTSSKTGFVLILSHYVICILHFLLMLYIVIMFAKWQRESPPGNTRPA